MRRWLSIVLLMLLGGVLPAGAQSFRGTIVGTVKDPSGAVLPGVDVTVTNAGTRVARAVVTNEAGDYAVPLLPPGTYSVTAALSGFKTEVRSGITLQVDQVARVDMTLQVGEVSETVEVIGDAPLINTETSTVGTVIENRKVVELPLNGRQFFQLNLLVPGASTSVQGSQNSTQGGAFVVNGAREQDNNFLIDGIDNNDLAINIFAVPLSVDAIQEFKLQASSYTAEFGRSGGAQINVSTKSGTNALHGTLFEFLRNSELDAKNFFDRPDQPIPPFKRNQFGGSAGGPIVKNRTFWFFNSDTTRVRQAVTQLARVPTVPERNGDFSGPGQPTIFDPSTFNPQTRTRQPFLGNRIPPNRINPVSRRVLDAYVPMPNLDGRLNYVSSPTAPRNIIQWTTKIDHKFSQNDDFFGRYTLNDDDRFNEYEPFGRWADIPGFGTHTLNRHMHAGTSWIHIFSPSVINDLKLGYNRFTGGIWQKTFREREDRNTAVGIKGTIRSPINFGLMRMSIPGFTNLGDRAAQNRHDNTYQISDTFSFTTGNHRFKWGIDIRRFQINILIDGREQVNFAANFTSNPQNPSGTGSAFADYLLGFPISASLPTVNGGITDSFIYYQRTTNSSYYFQDDWKIHPNLALNLGIRYELNTPVVEHRNRQSNFEVETGTIVVAGPQKRKLYDMDINNFAPRFGFAWTPTGKTKFAIRGGYGIFYSTKLLNVHLGLAATPPYRATLSFTSGRDIPEITIDDPFSGQGVPPRPTGTSIPKNFPEGYTQQWSLNGQREILRDLVFDIGYVGNKGTKLDRAFDPNQPLLGPGRVDDRRPFPNFGGITRRVSAADSIYHSLQTKIEKRFSQGLTFLSSYTWSKGIDNASSWGFTGQNSYNFRDDRGLSDYDVRHRYTFSYVYELPFGNGRKFLSSLRGIPDAILGGWQTSGILTLQTGNPFIVTIAQDRANVGTGNQRPNRIANANLPAKERTPDRWFNTQAFVLPDNLTYGNAGRNIIEVPGLKNADFSLMKNFQIREGQRLQFRAEFFNFTNHPNLDRPSAVFDAPTTFGRIQSANSNSSRQTQFGLKYYF